MREVFACVEVFEEAGGGFEVGVAEVEVPFGRVAVRSDGVDEVGGFYEEGLVRAEGGFGVAGADVEGYDGGFEIAAFRG